MVIIALCIALAIAFAMTASPWESPWEIFCFAIFLLGSFAVIISFFAGIILYDTTHEIQPERIRIVGNDFVVEYTDIHSVPRVYVGDIRFDEETKVIQEEYQASGTWFLPLHHHSTYVTVSRNALDVTLGRERE